MELVQQALLSTVDRILTQRGDDPSVIAQEDKVALAIQLVELSGLREIEIQRAAQELAYALDSSPEQDLIDLAATARLAIESYRSAA